LNQIVKAAVTRLIGIVRSAENRRRLAELAFAFAEIGSIPINQLPWDKVVIDRTNLAWQSLLAFARLILGRRHQTTSLGDARGFSLMFEMNTLFEEYIGRMMRRALMGTGLDVRLQGPGDHALSEQDGTLRFATWPDIVVCQGGVPVLIIDTKWKRLRGAVDDPKRGVGQADVYQMMAYSRVYGCGRQMLLYPHHNELGSDEGRLGTYQMRGAGDARLSVASISLSNLSTVSERLRELVVSELGSHAFMTDCVA
jgi:5-methylcytosine-specific restriction enzyme subunit McrC